MEAFIESLSWVHFWIVLAAVMLVVEIFTAGFWALPFSISSLVTALVAWFHAPMYIQVGAFAIFSFISVLSMQWMYKKYVVKPKDQEVQTGVNRLVGQTAYVTEAIQGDFKKGEVKVGGEEWRAVSTHDGEIAPGSKVTVEKVDGAKLWVKPMEEAQASE